MLELLAVAAAGAAAGASNSIAGAGSLITFPTMVALGQGERFARFLVPLRRLLR